ncbi:MAG: ribonuclease P protein component [Ethanoligenens sp.]|uniref:ribonuclease P protein component n=1 Tax=Ethanoligenens sp. TaxID=2099655 RepID=UPI0039EB892B
MEKSVVDGQGRDGLIQKTISLTENRDFRRLYHRGRNMVHPCLVLYYARNRLGHNRVGITTSKKIGKAVARNRARRIIREAYRQLGPAVKSGWDVVFVARSRTPSCKMGDVSRIMGGMFKSAGIMKK